MSTFCGLSHFPEDYCFVVFYTNKKIIFYSFIETSVSEIEETFLQFTNRNDIAILLINQNVRFKNALVS